MQEKKIVVVGAGVSGLTTALLLSENPRYRITVAAKHMPGDYDIDYASPWAGADYLPYTESGSKDAEREEKTWSFLHDLAANHPEAGVHFQTCKIFTRTVDAEASRPKFDPNPWWRLILPDYKDIPKVDLPPGIAHGKQFTSVCINTAIYLPYLVGRCVAAGIILKRAVFKHISQAAAAGVHNSGSHADLVLNCTGLSSFHLGGVEDKSMYPIRGQIALIRNDAGGNFAVSSTDDGVKEGNYGMVRAAGGGTILGGCRQKGNWDGGVDFNLANRILARAIKVLPGLGVNGIEELDVVRHGVGLRPGRDGGVRIERETIEGVQIVHNYGHAGTGYQASYGCALEAIKLVEESFNGDL